MRNRKVLLAVLSAILIVASTLSFLYIVHGNHKSNGIDNLPGTVIGPNPDNIPEDQLPACGFTGAGFVEQPCYSPPDAQYNLTH
jgi:hypothetical protein